MLAKYSIRPIIYTYADMYIYIFICTTHYTYSIPNLNVYMLYTYTCIFIHGCRRGEHCMMLWPQYLTGSFPSASDRCPATSALPWGRRVATWWTKSVPSGKLMLQDSQKTGVLLHTHIKMNTFNCNLQWKNYVAMLNFWLRLVYYPRETQVSTMLL